MDSRTYEEKLRDPRWQRRRLQIFQRDNWTCQLCSRTDLELHVHHLYRTTTDPWDEPDLHLLTVCQLCHSRQPSNPRGGFQSPQRLYKTDEEWWKAHRHEYDLQMREELNQENLHGFTLRELNRKIARRGEAIHKLRLAWEEKQKTPDLMCEDSGPVSTFTEPMTTNGHAVITPEASPSDAAAKVLTYGALLALQYSTRKKK